MEPVAQQHQNLDLIDGGDGGRARAVVEQRHLAKVISGAKLAEHVPTPFHNDPARMDYAKPVADLALGDDRLAGEVGLQAQHMIDDTVNDYVLAATADGYAEDWDLEQLWTNLRRLYPVSITIEDLIEESGGERNAIDAEFMAQQLKDDAQAEDVVGMIDAQAEKILAVRGPYKKKTAEISN